jgi:hypothetical protein
MNPKHTMKRGGETAIIILWSLFWFAIMWVAFGPGEGWREIWTGLVELWELVREARA